MAGTIDLAAVWTAATDELADEIISAAAACLPPTDPAAGDRRGHRAALRAGRVHPGRHRVAAATGHHRGALPPARPPDPGRGHRSARRGRRRAAGRHRLPQRPGIRPGRDRPGRGRLPGFRPPVYDEPQQSYQRDAGRPGAARRAAAAAGPPSTTDTVPPGSRPAGTAVRTRSSAPASPDRPDATTPPPTGAASRNATAPSRARSARLRARVPGRSAAARPARSARWPATAPPTAARVERRRPSARWRRPTRCGGQRQPAQPEVHVRDVRHRLVQPVRPRGGGRGGRVAGEGVQPAVHLRQLRAGQDPPAARDRALRHDARQRPLGPVRLDRGVHQRLHQLAAGRQDQRVPAALPRRRHPADRRHPVPGEPRADPGGVLPHLQHPAQRQQADRDHLRPLAASSWPRWRTGCGPGSSGACWPTSSRPTWRPGSRSCRRRPPRSGCTPRRTCWSSSPPGSRTRSGSSRAR